MSTSISVAAGVVALLLVVGIPVLLLLFGLMFIKGKKKPMAHEQERDEIMANVAKDFVKKWEDKRTADLGQKFKDIMG